MKNLLENSEFIEGIGPTYSNRLAEYGIETVGEVLASPVSLIAGYAEASPKLGQRWHAAARMLSLPTLMPNDAEALVDAGIEDLGDLARAPFSRIGEIIGRITDELAEAWRDASLFRRDVIVIGALEEDVNFSVNVGHERFPRDGHRFVARVPYGEGAFRITAEDDRSLLMTIRKKRSEVTRAKIKRLPPLPQGILRESHRKKIFVPHARIRQEKITPADLSPGAVLRVMPDNPKRAVQLSRRLERGVMVTTVVELDEPLQRGVVVRWNATGFDVIATDFKAWSRENQ